MRAMRSCDPVATNNDRRSWAQAPPTVDALSDLRQAALSEALRRMANFDHDLEQQRAALKRCRTWHIYTPVIGFATGRAQTRPADTGCRRRRKKEPGAMADDESLTALVVEKGQALSQCQAPAPAAPSWP